MLVSSAPKLNARAMSSVRSLRRELWKDLRLPAQPPPVYVQTVASPSQTIKNIRRYAFRAGVLAVILNAILGVLVLLFAPRLVSTLAFVGLLTGGAIGYSVARWSSARDASKHQTAYGSGVHARRVLTKN